MRKTGTIEQERSNRDMKPTIAGLYDPVADGQQGEAASRSASPAWQVSTNQINGGNH